MKHYNFCLSLLILLCNTQTFCIETHLVNVTLLSKSDIHKYWTMKQIAEKHNISGVFINRIHPLLMSFKLSIAKTPLELTYMKTFGPRSKTCFAYENEFAYQSLLDLSEKISRMKPTILKYKENLERYPKESDFDVDYKWDEC